MCLTQLGTLLLCSNQANKLLIRQFRTEELLSEILEQLKTNNRDNRLWSASDIADYLGMALGSVQNRIIYKVDLPISVSIKTENGRTNQR